MLLRKNHFIYFSGDVQKRCFSKGFRKLPEERLLKRVSFKKCNISNLPPVTIWKLTPSQVFSLSVLRIFRNVGRTSEVRSLFRKVIGENSAFYSSVQKSVMVIVVVCHWYVPKSSFFRNFKILPITGFADYIAVVVKMFWKFWRISGKSSVCNRVPQAYNLQPSTLRVF